MEKCLPRTYRKSISILSAPYSILSRKIKIFNLNSTAYLGIWKISKYLTLYTTLIRRLTTIKFQVGKNILLLHWLWLKEDLSKGATHRKEAPHVPQEDILLAFAHKEIGAKVTERLKHVIIHRLASNSCRDFGWYGRLYFWLHSISEEANNAPAIFLLRDKYVIFMFSCSTRTKFVTKRIILVVGFLLSFRFLFLCHLLEDFSYQI